MAAPAASLALSRTSFLHLRLSCGRMSGRGCVPALLSQQQSRFHKSARQPLSKISCLSIDEPISVRRDAVIGRTASQTAAPGPAVESSVALPSGVPACKGVDLRSDTITLPTDAMRAAMASAEVGDDVFGEDPTVTRLQEETAKLLGKEAGLFVPSGTMGNLIAVLVHCQVRGSEMIVGADSHIHMYEQGGSASLGGVHPRTVPNQPDGTLDLAQVEEKIRPDDDHYPVTRLICIENTHNRCGGRVLSVEYTEALGALAHRYGVNFHIDGARIFNAAVALNVDVHDLVRPADSVSVCLSKGLAAPLGSVLVGSADFIRSARRMRKALGGGMRQVGVVAAAGLVALNSMVDRLRDDHAHACMLAEGLNRLKGLHVDMSTVDSNIVLLGLTEDCEIDAMELSKALEVAGVQGLVRDARHIRFVTHYHITEAHIRRALAVFEDILGTANEPSTVY